MNKLDSEIECNAAIAAEMPDTILILQQAAESIGWPEKEMIKKHVVKLQNIMKRWGME